VAVDFGGEVEAVPDVVHLSRSRCLPRESGPWPLLAQMRSADMRESRELSISEAATDEIAGHTEGNDDAKIDQHECLEGHRLLLWPDAYSTREEPRYGGPLPGLNACLRGD
jgi:hypothetical protein